MCWCLPEFNVAWRWSKHGTASESGIHTWSGTYGLTHQFPRLNPSRFSFWGVSFAKPNVECSCNFIGNVLCRTWVHILSGWESQRNVDLEFKMYPLGKTLILSRSDIPFAIFWHNKQMGWLNPRSVRRRCGRLSMWPSSWHILGAIDPLRATGSVLSGCKCLQQVLDSSICNQHCSFLGQKQWQVHSYLGPVLTSHVLFWYDPFSHFPEYPSFSFLRFQAESTKWWGGQNRRVGCSSKTFLRALPMGEKLAACCAGKKELICSWRTCHVTHVARGFIIEDQDQNIFHPQMDLFATRQVSRVTFELAWNHSLCPALDGLEQTNNRMGAFEAQKVKIL